MLQGIKIGLSKQSVASSRGSSARSAFSLSCRALTDHAQHDGGRVSNGIKLLLFAHAAVDDHSDFWNRDGRFCHCCRKNDLSLKRVVVFENSFLVLQQNSAMELIKLCNLANWTIFLLQDPLSSFSLASVSKENQDPTLIFILRFFNDFFEFFNR